MATLLIVEDDDNIRLLLEARLKTRYGVVTADCAEKAFEVLEKENAGGREITGVY